MGNFSNGVEGNLLLLMIICGVIRAVQAAVYTVGDTPGWAIGADYGTWASDKNFSVGDTLVFNYPPGHTVDEVSANDYKTCTVGNAIATDSSGATSVVLKTAGPHYFICSIPGHCGGGLKLAVTVVAAAGGGGGGGTTTPPSTTTSPATPVSLAPPAAVVNPGAGTMTEPFYSSARQLLPSAATGFAVYICVVLRYFV